MSLLVKAKPITIEDEKLYCVIDIKSIATYKDLTGESFLKAVQRVADLDDIVLINLLASCLRRTPDGEPVGMEYVARFNPLALITDTMDDIVELLESSLPKQNPGDVAATKKKKK